MVRLSGIEIMDLEILRIASNTENHKIIHNHTHISKQKNPLCGDEMEIALKVKNNKLIDFSDVVLFAINESIN